MIVVDWAMKFQAPARADSKQVGFLFLMGSWRNYLMLQSQSAGASWLFVKPPHLDTIQLQGKTLRKTNTLSSAAR